MTRPIPTLFETVRDAASIAVVGTAKNVGKTVTTRALVRSFVDRGAHVGLTSIGRDGEVGDALDGAAKPRLFVRAGTLVATAREVLPRSPGCEILETIGESALGSIAIVRVLHAAFFEVAGPPTATGLRDVVARLVAHGAAPAIVDGAIDRIAALAGGEDAIVVATGAESGTTVDAVARVAADLVARLQLRRYDRAQDDDTAGNVVRIDGALDSLRADALFAEASGCVVVVRDPTRVLVRGRTFERLRTHVDLRCERPLRVVACTTSSVARGHALDPHRLVSAVAERTGLPTFDVLAGLAA
jgi:uncharacterized NAD-dependent epimerase/dehydratase family protein